MRILGISGSTQEEGTNHKLLRAIGIAVENPTTFTIENQINNIPLFSLKRLENPQKQIQQLKENIDQAQLVIICTPEYLHNIPAALKNILEWCTASGEFYQKKVLPITFTPKEPRGEMAMRSFLQSLKALKCNIKTHLNLYHQDVLLNDKSLQLKPETKEMILASIDLYQ
ncbi:NAD(P)H-dependent oxidoreductase [Mesonia sp. HuA40]|uniref:NAD(P)H-dependent oxidoreductase n=1 Tax=Mesonia sp. HuA40 TaxID=2602761 RepID=UPI0011CC1037|nr:NAD(P)H-dependent oxidoreductase [Mesonia sp. HuA40]TXK71029.1 NAD(P)H-dependent oxidoreductase [Mesonia sp. HuA40]